MKVARIKEKSSKGISPLVAAVLLIAVTMTLAGVLAFWATGFVRTQLEERGENETIVTECPRAAFSIHTCKYNSTTREIIIFLENLKEVTLKDLKAYVIYKDLTFDLISLNKSLPGISLERYNFTVAQNFSSIEIRTHCPDVKKVIEQKSCE